MYAYILLGLRTLLECADGLLSKMLGDGLECVDGWMDGWIVDTF